MILDLLLKKRHSDSLTQMAKLHRMKSKRYHRVSRKKVKSNLLRLLKSRRWRAIVVSNSRRWRVMMVSNSTRWRVMMVSSCKK
jgi:hypothetical protein